MTGQQSPPEIGNIPLLETKSLKNKSVPWENIELPIDILLLTVDEWEFLSCLSFLNSEFSKSYHDDLGFLYFGDIGEDEATKLKISVMKCYAGAMVPAGATVAVQNAVRALRPKAVISVGSCASLNLEKAKLGDVVVSAKLIIYAPTKHTDNGIEQLGHSVPPKKHLADLIKSVDHGWEAPLKKPGELVPTVVRDGVFLSGPEEVKSQQRCAQLTKQFPNAVAIEMEGEGLYAAAHALDIEWIIIKGISEYADGSGASQDSWRRFASVMAASLTVNMLSEPIVFQRWPHYGDSEATSSSTVAKRKGKSLLTGGSAPKRSKSAPRSKARNAKQSKATPSTSTNAVRPGFHQGKDDVYNMTSSPRGQALIINNKTFLNPQKDRLGSEHDVLEVRKLFQELGFKVTTKENLTKDKLLSELYTMAREDHSRYDCFVLWLMSHGEKDFVYGTDGEKIKLDKVRELFSNSSCSSLDGKPKVVFTQACRGDGEEFVASDWSSPALASQKSLPLPDGAKPANQGSHSRAHFLEAYSTVDGFNSYRNEKRGSYFVQCLVQVFRERVAEDDIDTMLIEVNRRLSEMKGRVLRKGEVKEVKFTCQFINSLTKKLYF